MVMCLHSWDALPPLGAEGNLKVDEVDQANVDLDVDPVDVVGKVLEDDMVAVLDDDCDDDDVDAL